MANVTKRTVDYYTNLGLLKAERSASNYRFYRMEELEKLRRIVKYKERNYSLEEIKELLQSADNKSEIDEKSEMLKRKMQGLNKDLQEVIHLIEKDKKQDSVLKKHISHESMAMIQSLVVLLT